MTDELHFTPVTGSGGQLPLALTLGEPAGIGPDIALMAWHDRTRHQLPAFAAYGDASALADRARLLGLDAAIEVIGQAAHAPAVFDRALPVIDIALARPTQVGRPDSANGRAVITSIERATSDVARGAAAALVTGPIAKSVLYEAGFRHPGHTEFLAELAARHNPGPDYKPVMMLAAEELRVVPLTIHVALASVPAMITASSIIETCRIMHRALVSDFGIATPRIAVAGLNPHAGEDGTMGTEDRDVISPAIAALQAEGLAVTGPHSADTLFHDAARRRYDAALAMYHDQALIPIKTLAFDRGVNVTLGLPFVRTSPDHGTAFDIAGTGRASAISLIEALRLAHRLAARRLETRRAA